MTSNEDFTSPLDESSISQLEPKPKAQLSTEADLKGKVAIVTGGGWNIGRAVALRLARHGARVIITSRNSKNLEHTAREAAGEDLYVRTFTADLTKQKDVHAMVGSVIGKEGPPDILACMAGGFGAGQPLQETDPGEWLEVLLRNLFSTYLSCRAVLPSMLERKRGDILTCAGGGAFFPLVGVHATAYATAKAGICRFTDQLYAEILEIPGIRVNAMDPGLTWSPRDLEKIEMEERETGRKHPMRERNHPPEDGAELACFLLSPAARTLNGRLISVDEDWWRDSAKVKQVVESDLYRLRRTFLPEA